MTRYSPRYFTPLLILIVVLLSCCGCQMHGDPYVDGIGFSSEMAERRLAEKRGVLRATEESANAAAIRSVTLKREIADERAHQQASDARMAELEQDLADAQKALAAAKEVVGRAEREGSDTGAAIRRRDQLQDQVNRLTQELATELNRNKRKNNSQ